MAILLLMPLLPEGWNPDSTDYFPYITEKRVVVKVARLFRENSMLRKNQRRKRMDLLTSR
jgi:hypothetical protein